MRTITILLVIIGLVLSGCSSKNDMNINKNHDEMLATHATQAQTAVTSQANAIKEVSKFECTESMSVSECVLGKAFVALAAGREIASITFSEFKGERPKTSVDAQIKVAEVVGEGIPTLGMTVTAVSAVRNKQGSVTMNAQGDATNTREEIHSTATANEGNSTASHDSSTKEEFVAPEIEESE